MGEHAKVALLSVTEGEDKPLKYPVMFQQADCLLVTFQGKQARVYNIGLTGCKAKLIKN